MVIDFHSHILPGIDDGSRNLETTCKMLETAAKQGIDVMVATPHFYADRMRIDPFLNNREEAYQKVMECSERVEQLPIICGSEVAYFHGIGGAEEIDKLCIGDTRLMLLEMPFRPWSGKELDEVGRLLDRNIVPVIAHLERFFSFQKDKKIIPELMEMPVYIQINAEAFLDWRTRRKMAKLFQNGDAHLLGSDAHSLNRRPVNLAEGRRVLEKKAGREVLAEIDQLGEKLLGLSHR